MIETLEEEEKINVEIGNCFFLVVRCGPARVMIN